MYCSCNLYRHETPVFAFDFLLHIFWMCLIHIISCFSTILQFIPFFKQTYTCLKMCISRRIVLADANILNWFLILYCTFVQHALENSYYMCDYIWNLSERCGGFRILKSNVHKGYNLETCQYNVLAEDLTVETAF